MWPFLFIPNHLQASGWELVRVAGKMLRCYTPEYNQRRPHSALSYRPPAPESRLPRSQAQSSIPWSGL